MGYYTNYKLEIIEDLPYSYEGYSYSSSPNLATHTANIENIIKYNPFEEPTTWYGHKKEMLKYSKQYPHTVFKLSGDGEDNTDMWVQYFKNGKSQYCPANITFDEFNEAKLE